MSTQTKGDDATLREARALLEESRFGRSTESERTLRLAEALVQRAEALAESQEFVQQTAAWFDLRDPEERLTIYASSNVTRGKAAAAAVHAALMHYGIPHGAVIVLSVSPSQIERECEIIVRDAGRTEVEPGTVTGGTQNRTTGAAEAQQTPGGAEKSQELTTTDDR